MTKITFATAKRRPAIVATGVILAATLALGSFSGAARAEWHDRDHRGERAEWRDRDYHGEHHDWDRGYYRAPPVVYGRPYYAPPVVYGSPFGLNLNIR
jgi:hypothetical protein